MFKKTLITFIILFSSFAFCENSNKSLYSGQITLVSVKVINENIDNMISEIYDNFPQEKNPVEVLSSYGEVFSLKEIKFINVEQDKTTLLNKNKQTDNFKGVATELSVFKNKDYFFDLTMYSYDDGSRESFSTELNPVTNNYITLNGYILYPPQSEKEMFYTFAFLKLEKP